MAKPTIKILRRMTGVAGAPAALDEGALAFNRVDNKLYIGSSDPAVSDVIAGKGAFIDLATEQSVTGKKNFTAATVSTAPAAANDIVRKTDLETAITALGSVFNYVGEMNLSSGAWLESDITQSGGSVTTGDYYRITGTGEFKYGGNAGPSGATMVTLQLKAGDALVKTTTDWQKIDNVDVVVSGTPNEISVSGDESAGYSVALATEFKTLVDGKLAKASNLSDLSDASLSRTNLGLGSMAVQDSSLVAVTGGSINGTAIGATTASTGAFTSISASGNLVGNGTSQITDFIIDCGVY